MNRNRGAMRCAIGVVWILWAHAAAVAADFAADGAADKAAAGSAVDHAVLENAQVALVFQRSSGQLCEIRNKRTGETYGVAGDFVSVAATDFRVGLRDARPVAWRQDAGQAALRYESGPLTVDVVYRLGKHNAFAEKRVALSAARGWGAKQVCLSQPAFAADGLRMLWYRYPKFMRPPGTEPISTFFGRTGKGGLFCGVEMPFDASSAAGTQVTLAFKPSLKIAPGERLDCEPAYFGVYARTSADRESPDLPMASESAAMVAMTSAVLGPPRHGLVPMACGWHCDMDQYAYTEASLPGELASLDFLAECGVDWLSDSHPWGGETLRMNALRADERYSPGPLVRRWLEHAKRRGLKVVMWPTMNNTHPWYAEGRPFRADRPEWLLKPGIRADIPDLARNAKANCVANTPFWDWLTRINREGLATGYYPGWAMDGSFFGDGGWYTTIVPVNCTSDRHDHLPGDSNYASQRALDRLIAAVRTQCPDEYIFMCRPPMDLGVWSLRNVDVNFTLLESGTAAGDLQAIAGLGPRPVNVAAGDQIRTWSRIRVHQHFFPHYLDQPLAFPSRADRKSPPNWPRGHLDYILLSALSSSPNQLYYLPTKTGIPAEDKAEIRKWLDWGRRNIEYLKVRKDLPDWPGQGKVDGSAHCVGRRGFLFLFNPNPQAAAGAFTLDEPTLGLAGPGPYRVTQRHPPSDRTLAAAAGATIRWETPAQTAVVLQIEPASR